MIGIVTIFYILTYNSFKEIVGWPTADILPERFRLIAAQIYEPNALLDSEGSIYLWLTNMDNLAGLGTPRSYELPYSKEIHEKVSKALVDIKNGIPQRICQTNRKAIKFRPRICTISWINIAMR